MLARVSNERGQALILMVGAFTVILVVAAFVIDFGLWMAERRSMQRAADLAAVSAAQELLIEDWATVESSAFAYAEANGYTSEPGGVEVRVDPLCRNQLATTRPPDDICTNAAAPASSPCVPGDGCDSLRVTISKPASLLFASIFSIGDGRRVGASAAAGVQFGGGGAGGISSGPQQTVILLDAQGRMGNGCNSSPEVCPMTLAKNEAKELADLLLDGDGPRQVGFAAFTYCYEGPPNYPLPAGPNSHCIPADEITPLTSDESLLHADIDATRFRSGAVANVCLPLLQALRMFEAQPTTPGRAVVFLSDGDNRYDHSTYFEGIGYPPVKCRPNPYDETQPRRYGACEGPVPEELTLDRLTIQVANDLKALGAEIYVVAFNVCGPDDGETIDSPGYCDDIGVDNAHDNIANQRLLKCIASSPDHYIRVDQPELPGTFQDIALDLSNRGLLQ